ncbi:hypothetical protein GCM10023205_55970 [Yinghuangia aomiensis]|uniref:PASTA domain-containing protein n=1 Tax=Yinghuangia aomiensis TaxID=676205 RepID=A0ABP9HWS2_9ACTN
MDSRAGRRTTPEWAPSGSITAHQQPLPRIPANSSDVGRSARYVADPTANPLAHRGYSSRSRLVPAVPTTAAVPLPPARRRAAPMSVATLAGAALAMVVLVGCGGGGGGGAKPAAQGSAVPATAASPSAPVSAEAPTPDPSAAGVTTQTGTAPPRVSPSAAKATPTPSSAHPSAASAPARPPQDAATTVPNVGGIAYADAAARLTSAGLTAARVDEVSSRPAGTVLRSNPPSGTSVAKGTRVTVTVAKADDTTTTVPAIKDMYPKEARAAVQAAGLAFDPTWVRNADDATYSHCRMWEFTPAAGTVVKKGTMVDVTRVYGCG